MDQKDEEIKRALDEIFGDEKQDVDLPNANDINNELIPIQSDDINNSGSNEEMLDIEDEEKIEQEKEPVSNRKIIIYLLIGFVIGLLILFFLIEKQEINKSIVTCSYLSEDSSYKETIEYKITKKENEITYVEGSYSYLAKTDEYKSKIESVKEEKIPIIINSNGMKGFTYVYEVSDKLFKMNSYLNYEEFDLDVIKKIDQEKVPISPFKVDLEKKYDELQKTLKKDGFICTISN